MKIEYRKQSPSVITSQEEIMKKIRDGSISRELGGEETIIILNDDEHAFEISANHTKNVEALFEQLLKDLKALSF